MQRDHPEWMMPLRSGTGKVPVMDFDDLGFGFYAKLAGVFLLGAIALIFVVVLSDTHLTRGGRRLPAECLELVDRADLVLHAGDFTTVPVYEELGRLAPLEAVRGNIDEPALQTLLPERRVVDAGAVRIGMVHDAGARVQRAERLVDAFPGCAAVVYGHTHLPEVSRHRGVWILNPGSPTERRRAPFRSLLTLELDGDRLASQLVALP